MEYIVETGVYKGCIMKIQGGQITYRPIPKNQDPNPIKSTGGLARADSPINKVKEEFAVGDSVIILPSLIEEYEPDYSTDGSEGFDCDGLHSIFETPGLSVITRNKLLRHFEAHEIPQEKLLEFYTTVVGALMAKKTFKTSIELGGLTLK